MQSGKEHLTESIIDKLWSLKQRELFQNNRSKYATSFGSDGSSYEPETESSQDFQSPSPSPSLDEADGISYPFAIGNPTPPLNVSYPDDSSDPVQELHSRSVEGATSSVDQEFLDSSVESPEPTQPHMDINTESLNQALATRLMISGMMSSLPAVYSPNVPLPNFASNFHQTPIQIAPGMVADSSNLLVRALTSSIPRRPRSEKKPTPDTHKDGRYYERRKRNNLAAKKSRDARKQREDQIALRATFLERENAILRTQVASLREEATALRLIAYQRKAMQ